MERSFAELADEVLALPRAKRVQLLDQVVASLDAPGAQGTDAEWEALVAWREAQIESGEVVEQSLEVVLERLRAELE